MARDNAAFGIASLDDGVAHSALIALDVEFDAGREQEVRAGLGGIGAIVRQRQERAAERVEVRPGRSRPRGA